MGKNNKKSGFTLIELSLVIAFLSILLLAIATLTNGVIAIYKKGVTINAVNAVGRSIIDDVTESINSAPGITVERLCKTKFAEGTEAYNKCVANGAKKFIYHEEFNGTNPAYGAFCTGKYSYIWQTGYALTESETGGVISVNYKTTAGDPGTVPNNFKFLKILDTSRYACTAYIGSDYDSTVTPAGNVLNFTAPVNDVPSDLIASTDNTLAIYHVYISSFTTSDSSQRILYSGSFVLSTLRGDVDIVTRSGNYCSVNDEDFDYCAINKFNFVAQAIGGD